MCGIVGYYAFDQFTETQKKALEKGVLSLKKRGPDADHTWQDDRVLLGHTRLSIIDTSRQSDQPFHDAEGRYHIIFNGEIYNYRQLRDVLENKGYAFRTQSDTEVLLTGYIEWGHLVLDRLNGFFAFAVYDQLEQTLFIARDRIGIKPLVYSFDDDGVIFGSELKALHPFLQKPSLNRQALNLYFQLTYIPAPLTIYDRVYKLEAGHYIRVHLRRVKKQPYYQLPYRSKPSIQSFGEAVPIVRELMERSVERRLIADVPVGTFLSGGIDSSIITALAAQQHEKIDSFSIGYQDHPYFDETDFALSVSKKWNTQHHVFSLTNDDLLDHVHQVVNYLDEPFADSSALPVYILSQETRKHVKVALSGDGADELFSGYNKHEAWLMAQQKDWQNLFVRGLGGLAELFPQSRNSKYGDLARKILKYKVLLERQPNDQYWMLASFGNELQRHGLIKSGYFESLFAYQDYVLKDFVPEDFNSFLKKDVELVLAGDMLRKVDAMSMANGLEVRVPFLDHELLDFAFDLSINQKIQRGDRKRILKEAFKQELPSELLERGKHGFEVPLLGWFQNEMKAELDETVFHEEKVVAQGIFSWDYLMQVRNRLHSKNPKDASLLVWQLFAFQKWYDRYFMS